MVYSSVITVKEVLNIQVLENKLKILYSDKENIKANLNAVLGAIQELEQLIKEDKEDKNG